MEKILIPVRKKSVIWRPSSTEEERDKVAEYLENSPYVIDNITVREFEYLNNWLNFKFTAEAVIYNDDYWTYVQPVNAMEYINLGTWEKTFVNAEWRRIHLTSYTTTELSREEWLEQQKKKHRAEIVAKLGSQQEPMPYDVEESIIDLLVKQWRFLEVKNFIRMKKDIKQSLLKKETFKDFYKTVKDTEGYFIINNF